MIGDRTLSLYVPAAGTETPIVRGSAIVGKEYPDGIDVWFEGNIHGYANLQLFEDRVKSAAWRAFDRYPTNAKATFNSSELVAVGTVTVAPNHQVAISITDDDAVVSWCKPSAREEH